MEQPLLIYNPASKKAPLRQLENPSFYERTKVVTYGVPDVRAVGQAFEQVWGLCQSLQQESTKVMAKVDKSGWFKLIHKFLKTAKKIERSFIYLTESGY